MKYGLNPQRQRWSSDQHFVVVVYAPKGHRVVSKEAIAGIGRPFLSSGQKNPQRQMNQKLQLQSSRDFLEEIAVLKDEIKKLKSRKRYGLIWEDKPEEVAEQCKKKLPVLVEKINKAIQLDKNLPTNILIEGDNYHALSVLNYTHAGKIDFIYIDPPYNTGSEGFMYNDRIVNREDSYRHSKWISFMRKRLLLAKNLLTSAGIIFISIDDNEFSQLRLLMDEIFSESSMKTTIIWQKKVRPSNKNKNGFSGTTEYILMYSKSNKDTKLIPVDLNAEYVKKVYKNPDNDNRGVWRGQPLWSESNTNKRKTLILPDGREITQKWFISQRTLNELFDDNKITESKGGTLNAKSFLAERNGKDPMNLLTGEDVGTTEEATKELKEIMGISENMFMYPKPTRLIKFLISRIPENNKATILDFFAGSGTTGQAVLELNEEDDGDRKFILCTNNENDICAKVCFPRTKKIINGYQNLAGKKIKGLGGNLKYFKTDFIDGNYTDNSKKNLVDRSTEMLCIKEDCFEMVENGRNFKIFKSNSEKYLGIVYEDGGIDGLIEEIKKINQKFIVYVFSLDESTREEEFEQIRTLVELKPIPDAILNVYKRIFK